MLNQIYNKRRQETIISFPVNLMRLKYKLNTYRWRESLDYGGCLADGPFTQTSKTEQGLELSRPPQTYIYNVH